MALVSVFLGVATAILFLVDGRCERLTAIESEPALRPLAYLIQNLPAFVKGCQMPARKRDLQRRLCRGKSRNRAPDRNLGSHGRTRGAGE